LGDVTTQEAAQEAASTAEAVARASYGKLVAFLAASTRDVAAAEDALSDAFAAALAEWPVHGVPDRPEAWLITVGRRKLIDAARRHRTGKAAAPHLALLRAELDELAEIPAEIPDRRLALMLVCAHPAIDPAMRAPLMLQSILGLDAGLIASAFLISPASMGQRLVRAKARIRHTGIPFRLPEPEDLPERLDAVLDAIYAAFGSGWSDPAGTEPRRRDLAAEAIFLGRLVVALLPEQPEAAGLLALMLYAEARRGARRSPEGAYVPLAEQDPALWDAAPIAEAETLLRRASAGGAIGRFQLEAAIQSAHVVRRVTGVADWPAIEGLYEALVTLTGSPVAAVNHAVAVAETRGAAAGLALLDGLGGDRRLFEYQPYWACRAELLARSGAAEEADVAYRRAIGLETDEGVRRFLEGRRAARGRSGKGDGW
jgi:RNA polymerase sigma-70 factor, ECF subfamily